ncbi:MAG: DNA methyltransferase [Solirubrobacteraceae bacterium]
MTKPRPVKANVPPQLEAMLEPIDTLESLHGNARRGDVEVIRGLLRAHGQYQPIIARTQTREVLIGNHRLAAARAEKWTHIAVLWRDEPDDDRAQALAIADNVSSDKASWDYPGLAEALDAIPEHIADTGLNQIDIDHIIAQAALVAEEDDTGPGRTDDTAKPKARTTTRPGDLIELGRHRLLCGDARLPEAWAALLDGDPPAGLVWTDPPYGIDLAEVTAARGGTDYGEMAGDAQDDGELHVLTHSALVNAYAALRPGGGIYLAHADTKRAVIQDAFHLAGFHLAQTLIWVKDSLVLGRQDFQWRHEPILYGWRPGAAHTWNGQRTRTTVLDHHTPSTLLQLTQLELVELLTAVLDAQPGTLIYAARPKIAHEHPTAKPVDLVSDHLRYSSLPGDLVIDPFAGSGTTLVAAEQHHRTARLIELSAQHCDVIVQRFEDLTGEKAKRPRRARKPKTQKEPTS